MCVCSRSIYFKAHLEDHLKEITLHSAFFTNLDNLDKNSYGLFGDSNYYLL